MGNDRFILERKNKIALVTMNRPGKKNAFDEAMFSGLEQITQQLKQDLPRAIVLTGATETADSGKDAFCSGFDVNPENPLVTDFMKALETKNIESARQLINRIRAAVDGFVYLPVPIIAAINGLAYGGGMELATRCDLRVMDQRAVLCFSEVRLGLIPDWGGGPSLTKLVGPGTAADLILTARKVDAHEALGLGLVNRVSSQGKSLESAMGLAEQIAGNGPRAVRHALDVIRQSPGLSMEKALELEADNAARLIVSGECIHGITAFMEKKKPVFPDNY